MKPFSRTSAKEQQLPSAAPGPEVKPADPTDARYWPMTNGVTHSTSARVDHVNRVVLSDPALDRVRRRPKRPPTVSTTSEIASLLPEPAMTTCERERERCG